MEMIRETIKKVIAAYLDEDIENISATKPFEELGLDSLDIMDLVMQIEEELNCKIVFSPEIKTIDALAESIAAEAK